MRHQGRRRSSHPGKKPSAAVMQKCGLVALPDDFVPTVQEQALLDMYETVRQYERQAKRLREESARRKLEASKAAFEQRQGNKRSVANVVPRLIRKTRMTMVMMELKDRMKKCQLMPVTKITMKKT